MLYLFIDNKKLRRVNASLKRKEVKSVKKKLLLLVAIFSLILSILPVTAASMPVIYKKTITITEDGGRYQIGFINVEFKKDFLEKEKLPYTLEIQVYAENGKGYVEFSPGTSDFLKKVHIRVDAYKGQLYDIAKSENIKVNIKKVNILVDHFSRYCFT